MADLDLGLVGDVFMLASHGQEAPQRALEGVVAEVGRQLAEKLDALADEHWDRLRGCHGDGFDPSAKVVEWTGGTA